MKRIATRIPSVFLLLFASAGNAWSADFALSEVTLRASTRSTGGTFALTSTLGDPFVDTAVGGGFTLATGLPDQEVPQPLPVLLQIRRSPNAVILAWPVSTTNWEVEYSDDLGGAWQAFTIAPHVVEGERRLELSPSEARRFYRLRTD